MYGYESAVPASLGHTYVFLHCPPPLVCAYAVMDNTGIMFNSLHLLLLWTQECIPVILKECQRGITYLWE